MSFIEKGFEKLNTFFCRQDFNFFLGERWESKNSALKTEQRCSSMAVLRCFKNQNTKLCHRGRGGLGSATLGLPEALLWGLCSTSMKPTGTEDLTRSAGSRKVNPCQPCPEGSPCSHHHWSAPAAPAAPCKELVMGLATPRPGLCFVLLSSLLLHGFSFCWGSYTWSQAALLGLCSFYIGREFANLTHCSLSPHQEPLPATTNFADPPKKHIQP